MDNGGALGPGRPREAKHDRAILDAALELLIEGGVDAVKVDVAAKRSGVARGTVYRRYPRREDLVIEAVRYGYRSITLMEAPEDPTIDDMVDGISLGLAEERGRRLLRRMASVSRERPELASRLREEVGGAERERLIHDLLSRAAHRGLFPENADLGMIHTLFSAAIVAHLFAESDDVAVTDVRSHLFRALRALGYREDAG